MLSSLRAPLWTGAKRVNTRLSQQLFSRKKNQQREQWCCGREEFLAAWQLGNVFSSC